MGHEWDRIYQEKYNKSLFDPYYHLSRGKQIIVSSSALTPSSLFSRQHTTVCQQRYAAVGGERATHIYIHILLL